MNHGGRNEGPGRVLKPEQKTGIRRAKIRYADAAMTEAKRVSAHAAEGCLRHALLYLSDGSYEGGETIALSEYSCDILPILFGTSTITIRARSEVRGSRTNLEFVVDSYTLKRISFTEKNSF